MSGENDLEEITVFMSKLRGSCKHYNHKEYFECDISEDLKFKKCCPKNCFMNVEENINEVDEVYNKLLKGEK